MATIAITKRVTTGAYQTTTTAMTASDTLVYTQGATQELELMNPTASAVTLTINGSTVNTVYVAGYGTVSTSAGKTVAVPANSTVRLPLDAIAQYLGGTIALTGGTGLIATFISN